MGIRIRKYLGYGFVDVETEKVDKYSIKPIDTRFSPDGMFYSNWHDREDKWTVDGFLEHCKEVAERYDNFELKLLTRSNFYETGGKLIDNRFLSNCYQYDSEFGLPEVIIFQPIDQPEWQRYDDMIDYYEYAYERAGVYPAVKVLDQPLYPYDSYINNNNGKTADNKVRQYIYFIRNAEIDLKNPKLAEEKVDLSIHLINQSLEKLGCKSHWTEKWNVAIPSVLVEFLRYTNMFTDESSIWKLQPMIYTYWS